MKIESKIREDKLFNEREQDKMVKKQLISMVQDQRLVAIDEKERAVQQKKEIRDKVHSEIQEALEKRRAEDAAELRKREELIRQIRELEKIPIIRTQGFDPTETPGHGLLNEMSIAELRERIEYEKMRRTAEADSKREQNKKNKEDKIEMLTNQTEEIIKARNELKQQKERERYEKQYKKEQEELKRRQAREKGLLEAYERISEKKRLKKEEEDRLAAELRQIKLQREYLNADKSMMEKKAWKELEAGAERQARDKQNNKLLDQFKHNAIKVKDLTINATNNKRTIQNKIDYDKGYKERLETRKMENEILHKEVLDYKNTKYAKQKIQEETLKAKKNSHGRRFMDKKEKVQHIEDIDDGVDMQMDLEMDEMEGEQATDLLNVDDQMDPNGDEIDRMMEMEA